MPGGIDYSKWDNLDEYSDDEEENVTNAASDSASQPRVTRLDAPSRVTFGGGSDTIQATASPHGSLPSSSAGSKPPETTETAAKKAVNKDAKWREKGGMVTTSDNRRLYWSQDRYSVTLRCQLYEGKKPKTVKVEGILPYADRHCAMGSSKPHLIVSDGTAAAIVLEGDLPHQVHLADDEEEVDWCIERHPSSGREELRFIAITLYKAVPMQGLFVWWKRPLLAFEEIAIDQESSPASKEFLEAWEKAHRQFKEKKRDPPVQL